MTMKRLHSVWIETKKKKQKLLRNRYELYNLTLENYIY